MTPRSEVAVDVRAAFEATGLPSIDVSRQTGNVVTDIVAAVAAANTRERPRYVVLGGQLTYLDTDRAEALDPTALVQELGPIARAVTVSTRGTVRDARWPNDALRAACTPRVAALRRQLHDGRDLPPEVDRIARTPFVRPDGTVCSAAGVDPATRVLLAPADGLLERFRAPSYRDAEDAATQSRNAAKWIHAELLSEFPWTSGADLANTYAWLLTPLTREMYGLAPLFLIEASTRGSGKGLLTEIGAAIATGRPVRSVVLSSDEAEARKLITSTLAAGEAVVRFDEVPWLGSRALQKLLTEAEWTDRLLGSNTAGTWPNRVTWAATGNNPEVGGDMARRICPIRLTPDTGRPELQTFKKPDLAGWAVEHRPEVLERLLILVSAWTYLGRPVPCEAVTMGSFQGWADVMSGVLDLAGIDGFMANRDRFAEITDVDEAEVAETLAAIWHRHGRTPFTVAELAGDPTMPAPWRVADAKDDQSRRTAWGKWLARHRDRLVNGYRIRRDGTAAGRVARWRIEERGEHREDTRDELAEEDDCHGLF